MPVFGNALAGQQPEDQKEVAGRNFAFLQRPEVKAGLLQLGVSLLSPGSSFGSALGDALGAGARYNLINRQQGFEDVERAQQAETHEAGLAATQARTDATRAGIGQADRRLDIGQQTVDQEALRGTRAGDQRDRELGLREKALELDKPRIDAQRNWYNAQALELARKAGLQPDTITDELLFNAAVDVTEKLTEAKSLNEGSSQFSADQFGTTLNGLRRSVGKPPLPIYGQQQQVSEPTGPRAVLSAKEIRALLSEGKSPTELLRLQQKFDLSPEAMQELLKAMESERARYIRGR